MVGGIIVSKILVTGATGFTGSHLCRKLLELGHDVIAFVRSMQKASSLSNLGIECREVAITDRTDVFNNFPGIEKVFHIAAAYRAEHADRQEFFRVNVEATRNLLDAAKENGVERFVHCSTVGVQGRIDDPPADEAYRFMPGDHYQQSKLDGELLARKYFNDGLPGAVVRPVGIYGPGDTRFLKLFKPINKGYFVMIGSGRSLYHMTYIDDLIQGFLLAGSHPNAVGETFTIGGETYTTLAELVNLIADELGKPKPWLKVPYYPVFAASVVCEKMCNLLNIQPPLYPRRVEFFDLDRAFSIEKAKKLLGYRPAVNLREGLCRTAAWYREKGLI
jgi:nucleoside-diphosphate-sugar epimerase